METKETEKTIIGREAAIAFAEKHCTVDADYYIGKAKNGVNRWSKENAEKWNTLVIPGFSRAVEIYPFHLLPAEEWRDRPEHWVLSDSMMALYIEKTGELLNIYEPHCNAKKFGLYYLVGDRSLHLDHFSFNEPKPNFIGKGTQKKIQDWLDYLRRELIAKIEYNAYAWKRNREFQEALKAHFPDAKKRVDEKGWLIECWIEQGCIRYHYTPSDNGHFYRNYEIMPFEIPSTKDLLGIE